jgi:hypothetical protein
MELRKHYHKMALVVQITTSLVGIQKQTVQERHIPMANPFQLARAI